MGIMLEQNERTELQEQIAADLRRRAGENTRADADLAADSAYLEGSKQTGRFAWVWIVLVVLAIIALFIIFL